MEKEPKLKKKKVTKRKPPRRKKLGLPVTEINRKKQVSQPGNWADAPTSMKREIAYNWTMHGGVLNGKRWTMGELASALGMTLHTVKKMLSVIEQNSTKAFSDSSLVRDQVFSMLERACRHIERDRASALMHAQMLEEEIEMARDHIREAESAKTKTPKEEVQKNGRINSARYQFIRLAHQRTEGLKTLFESTKAYINFLELFAGKVKKNNEDGDGFFPSQGPSPEERAVLDRKAAIEILNSNQLSVLPKQNFKNFEEKTRNPNSGFEELPTDPVK